MDFKNSCVVLGAGKIFIQDVSLPSPLRYVSVLLCVNTSTPCLPFFSVFLCSLAFFPHHAIRCDDEETYVQALLHTPGPKVLCGQEPYDQKQYTMPSTCHYKRP